MQQPLFVPTLFHSILFQFEQNQSPPLLFELPEKNFAHNHDGSLFPIALDLPDFDHRFLDFACGESHLIDLRLLDYSLMSFEHHLFVHKLFFSQKPLSKVFLFLPFYFSCFIDSILPSLVKPSFFKIASKVDISAFNSMKSSSFIFEIIFSIASFTKETVLISLSLEPS